MKRSFSLVLGLALALTGAAAFAQTTYETTPAPAAPATSTLMAGGTVISTTPTALIIETSTGERLTFAVDSQSEIPTGLAAQNKVTVDYHRLADGSLHASRVTVTPMAAEVEPAPAPLVNPEPPAEEVPVADTDADDAGMDDDADDADVLPQTASPLGLLALLGSAALGGAGVLRYARKRD